MPVPNTFANATTSIPLSQLDANFATPITLGNTAIQLGNTVTTLNNMTLANVTVNSGNLTTSTVTVGAGSNTAPSITFSGDTNTGIYSPAADTIAFTEGGVEAMRIDSNANVGIGTSTPGARLAIQTAAGTAATQTIYTGSNAAAATLSFGQTGAVQWDTGITASSGDYRIAVNGGGTAYDIARSGTAINYHAFSTSGAERMRIDNAGRVGINTTGNGFHRFVVQEDTNTGATALFQAISNTAVPGLTFSRTRASNAAVQNGDQLGIIALQGFDGSAGLGQSTIIGAVDGAVSAGSVPTRVTFSTTPSGSLIPVERMRIDASGNVGIGTSSPGNRLEVLSAGGTSQFRVRNDAVTPTAYYDFGRDGTDGFFGFSGAQTTFSGYKWSVNAGTEVMRITNAGNVGIGTSSPASRLHVSGSSGFQEVRVSSGSNLNALSVDGTNAYLGTSSNIPLLFSTNNTERARITSGGAFLVNTTSPALGDSNTFNSISTSVDDWPVVARHTASNNNVRCVLARCPNFNGDDGYLFIGARSGGDRFYVLTSGNVQNSNNSYGAISDARLKENVVDATPKLEKLNQVRVVNYNLKGETHKQLGVVAQELEQIFPGMVEEVPARDADGNELGTKHKAVKYSVFVPMLIKAIQEQQAQIEELKARVAALENK